jgi:hypothetical protein
LSSPSIADGHLASHGKGNLLAAKWRIWRKKEFGMPILNDFRRTARLLSVAVACCAGVSTSMAQNGSSVPAQPAQGDWSPELGQLTGHPLEPALDRAYKSIKEMDRSLKDYTATLVKRERVDGQLTEHEYMFTKIRHKPFSVYMYFLEPEDRIGREVIYVEGQNDGNLVAHEAKGLAAIVGAVQLKPNSPLAMKGNRYPITEVGIMNLTRRLIEVGESDRKYGECDVKHVPSAKVNGRICTLIQVTHPVPRKNFRYHKALIYIDDELNIPIRFEAYDWPKEEGGQPVLLEEYTYVKIKLNAGLVDADFDPRNPNYKFYKK